MKTLLSIALLGLGVSALAWAGGTAPKQTETGVNYVVGGIGSDQRQKLNETYGGYSLRVEVAEKGGAYVADVHMQISDTQGKEHLQIMQDAPILLIDLPTGQYELTATYRDQTQKRKVSVQAGKQTKTTFTW